MLLGASIYLVPLLTATTACAKYFANGASEKYFTNEWSVQISSNNEIEAERAATQVKSIMKGEFQQVTEEFCSHLPEPAAVETSGDTFESKSGRNCGS